MLPKPFTRSCLLGVAAGLGLSWSCVMQPLQAATDVALVSGAFRRSIPVKEIEHLAETGEAIGLLGDLLELSKHCLLYTSPSPRDLSTSRMPSSA